MKRPLVLLLGAFSACGGRVAPIGGARDSGAPDLRDVAHWDVRDAAQPDLRDTAEADVRDAAEPDLRDAAEPDLRDATVADEGPCDPGVVVQVTSTDNHHVATGTPVVYDHEPPCIGPHWAEAGIAPAANGEYLVPLEPERYVHNLEHGAVGFLYDCPSGCTAIVDALRDYATMRQPDDGGAFRWVLSPRSGMPTTVSVVAWGWIQRLDTADIPAIDCFVDAHYRQAPEDQPTP